jgi:adenine-specific DNA-methyltransferase
MTAKQTSQGEATRMPLTSADIVAGREAVLREVMPEIFVEGRIDADRLRVAVGELVEEAQKRYGLTWSG